MTTLGRIACIAALALSIALPTAASAAEKVTFLLPGPENLPAFVPYQLARAKGYFAKAGLDVHFIVAKGGADVATQVAVGNADLGGGLGDTSMLVRANGLPVRGVALLGGGGLTTIIVRKDEGIDSIAGLKGKRIGVTSFGNTNYYALLAALADNGIRKSDVSIEAVGFAGIIKLMVAKQLDAISNVPENATQIEAGGVPVESFPVTQYFPAMAQAILASDKTIKERPQVVRGFVHAILQSLRDIMADPRQAAADYAKAVPQYKDKAGFIEDVLQRYAKQVYHVDKPSDLGKFDPARLAAVEKVYLDNNVIHAKVPVADLYTNAFVD
ncbi:MAG TPA: ABC transporter substrate-binding protein [Hyphomicrobiales bacterium]|nr:ABC transporter substrate-binding protein [Hyphomicrobiales bacterium]